MNLSCCARTGFWGQLAGDSQRKLATILSADQTLDNGSFVPVMEAFDRELPDGTNTTPQRIELAPGMPVALGLRPRGDAAQGCSRP